jgi:hypothetical protein
VKFKFILFPCCIVSAILWWDSKGYSSQNTPEHVVQQFYAWYFHADNRSVPAEYNDEIFNYVHKITVKSVRENRQSIYYFTKVGRYSFEWKEVETIVEKAHVINETMSLIPVRFKLSSEQYTIFVVVSRESEKLLITKVIDSYPDI